MPFSRHWFLESKKFVSRSVSGKLLLTQLVLSFNTFCWNLKIRGLALKAYAAFLIFQFWEELWSFKVKETMLFLEQKSKLQNQKSKMPHTLFERRSLCFSSCKSCKFKIKLDEWELAKEKKRIFFLFYRKKNFVLFISYHNV